MNRELGMAGNIELEARKIYKFSIKSVLIVEYVITSRPATN